MNVFHPRSIVLKGALVIATLACLLSIPSMSRATPHVFASSCAPCIFEYPIPTAKSKPLGITKGPDGNFWFTESAGNKIGKITTSGAITEYPLPIRSHIIGAPVGITTGPDGNLWFTDFNYNLIGKITTNGVIIAEFGLPVSKRGVSSQPDGITAGPDGNLWFTEHASNKIGKTTTSGAITEYPLPTAKSAPMGIASCGSVIQELVTTENAGNNIAEINTSGAIKEDPIPTANSAPAGIASDSVGCGSGGFVEWFTESNSNKIGALFFGFA